MDETVTADIAAIELELEQLRAAPSISQPKQQPKRAALPPELPRIEHRHEPDSTTCTRGCQLQRIGEDVTEKLDYVPGVFSVERHIRGKWACKQCQTLIQAPVPAHVIDKGMASTGLLAHVPEGSATAKALDYSLKRWGALMRYLDDGQLPFDNNRIEQQIRPIAVGRNNWLFAGSLRAGKRAAAVMTLIQSAKLNGHDPYAYLKDVLTRLPTQPASRIDELLPHNWAPTI